MPTQAEKQEALRAAVASLKRAAGFAETMLDEPVKLEVVSSLNQLTQEAACHVNKLRSMAAGNENPKVG